MTIDVVTVTERRRCPEGCGYVAEATAATVFAARVAVLNDVAQHLDWHVNEGNPILVRRTVAP